MKNGEKIMLKSKTRMGAMAIIFGLISVFTSFYIDQFLGRPPNALGLYQILGVLTGYLIAAVGVVLVVGIWDTRSALTRVLVTGGIILLVASAFADYLNIAGQPGFDKFQMVGIIFSVAVIVVGFGLRYLNLFKS